MFPIMNHWMKIKSVKIKIEWSSICTYESPQKLQLYSHVYDMVQDILIQTFYKNSDFFAFPLLSLSFPFPSFHWLLPQFRPACCYFSVLNSFCCITALKRIIHLRCPQLDALLRCAMLISLHCVRMTILLSLITLGDMRKMKK